MGPIHDGNTSISSWSLAMSNDDLGKARLSYEAKILVFHMRGLQHDNDLTSLSCFNKFGNSRSPGTLS